MVQILLRVLKLWVSRKVVIQLIKKNSRGTCFGDGSHEYFYFLL